VTLDAAARGDTALELADRWADEADHRFVARRRRASYDPLTGQPDDKRKAYVVTLCEGPFEVVSTPEESTYVAAEGASFESFEEAAARAIAAWRRRQEKREQQRRAMSKTPGEVIVYDGAGYAHRIDLRYLRGANGAAIGRILPPGTYWDVELGAAVQPSDERWDIDKYHASIVDDDEENDT
jgi:hypothetical protein